MDYPETLSYLYEQLPMFQRIGAAAYKADLSNTIQLNKILGNPELAFPSVHIAGTNGKGSVAHITASVLQESGYKTGLYTSPHLRDFRERIRINGKKISKGFITAFVKQHKPLFAPVKPSFFELTFSMAMSYFNENKIDIAVVETGMGGRLDSTNTVRSILSVITNISFDHTMFLGNTLEKIAAEKAGIIKPGIPVVIGETSEITREVFGQAASKAGSPMVFADRMYVVEMKKTGRTGMPVFDIRKNGITLLSDIRCPLGGIYQQKNLATACQTIEILDKNGWKIPAIKIAAGIEKVTKNTGFKGRWQVIGRKPLIICDTAHNEAGLRFVLSQLPEIPHRRLHMVTGFVSDKDIDRLLNLLPCSATFYFCKPDVPRGLDQNTLQQLARTKGLHGLACPSVTKALEEAKKNASADDLIFIGGSTFVVAEVV
ncbi:MAG: bifunctional folylpolyglutamate synthase/dihydrofolate synthase [Bacteroidales bacterium]|nr:bifunctional folylpolyglutamate synthase/dihydrofolate synthase [Bacteroidales bacterium]